MYRTIALLLALLLAALAALPASAHVGDITVVETVNFRDIPNCPVEISITRYGHVHHGTNNTGYVQLPNGHRRRVAHDRIFVSAGYGAWGRGEGVVNDPIIAAQPGTYTIRFPGNRGYTGSYGGELASYMRTRLRQYPPPTGQPGWHVDFHTGLDEPYEDQRHSISGKFSNECLVSFFGVDGDKLPQWQTTPSPTATPRPTPRPAPQPTPRPQSTTSTLTLEQRIVELENSLTILRQQLQQLHRIVIEMREE